MSDKRKKNLIIEEKAKYYAKISDFIDIIVNHQKLNSKSNNENKIIADTLYQSQFHMKLTEGGIDLIIINTFTKNPNFIQESNKIQKK